jgi:hypothetical protein
MIDCTVSTVSDCAVRMCAVLSKLLQAGHAAQDCYICG